MSSFDYVTYILRLSIFIVLLIGCGLPSSYVVPIPQITNIAGSRVDFSLQKATDLFYITGSMNPIKIQIET